MLFFPRTEEKTAPPSVVNDSQSSYRLEYQSNVVEQLAGVGAVLS